ncbi:MAG: DUF2721 domain-containing protein [Akkermansiaceae bacterium]
MASVWLAKLYRDRKKIPVTLEISTPALLFPAVSLLFLSYTNRFLHLAALVRKLHGDWLKEHEPTTIAQISNLRTRLVFIRWMQLLGALSLFLCVISMIAILSERQGIANVTFFAAVVMMSLSLASLMIEIVISGGATPHPPSRNGKPKPS